MRSADGTRGTALLAIAALVAALTGWASIGAGGYYPYGTATAGERQVGQVAVAIGALLALVLVIAAIRYRPVLGLWSGVALAVASLPLAVPAMWALGYPLNTPAADSFGCGTVTTPTDPDGVGIETEVGKSCRDRQAQQRALVGVLGVPPLLLLSAGVLLTLRKERTEQRDSSVLQTG